MLGRVRWRQGENGGREGGESPKSRYQITMMLFAAMNYLLVLPNPDCREVGLDGERCASSGSPCKTQILLQSCPFHGKGKAFEEAPEI